MASSANKGLNRARSSGMPVTLERKGLGPGIEELHGIVLAIGSEWVVLLALSQSVYADGWELVRTRHVSGVRSDGKDEQAYIRRALEALGGVPAPPTKLPLRGLSRPRKALVAALDAAPLVGVHEEGRSTGPVRIGRYAGLDRKHLKLHQIDAAGRWDAKVTSIRIPKVTRVTVGGRYQEALDRFGDPAPPAP